MGSFLMSNAVPQKLLTLPAASISATFALLGSFDKGVKLMHVYSTLNQEVILSFDGINDQWPVPSNDHFVLPLASCGLILPQFPIYVRTPTVATSGDVYIGAFCGAIT